MYLSIVSCVSHRLLRVLVQGYIVFDSLPEGFSMPEYCIRTSCHLRMRIGYNYRKPISSNSTRLDTPLQKSIVGTMCIEAISRKTWKQEHRKRRLDISRDYE